MLVWWLLMTGLMCHRKTVCGKLTMTHHQCLNCGPHQSLRCPCSLIILGPWWLSEEHYRGIKESAKSCIDQPRELSEKCPQSPSQLVSLGISYYQWQVSPALSVKQPEEHSQSRGLDSQLRIFWVANGVDPPITRIIHYFPSAIVMWSGVGA